MKYETILKGEFTEKKKWIYKNRVGNIAHQIGYIGVKSQLSNIPKTRELTHLLDSSRDAPIKVCSPVSARNPIDRKTPSFETPRGEAI